MENNSVDNYECMELLGEGMFGKTYMGFDKKNNRQVVIKKMANSAGLRLNLLNTFASPYTIKYYDRVLYNNELWLVMEYCPMGSLALVSKSGPIMTDATLAEIAAACLLGLSTLNENGMFHGDIKPSNLFVKGNGAIRLGDFCLSPLMGKSGLKKETAMYMAPEVFRDEAVMKSDVWSLGVTLMTLATGRNSYEGPNAYWIMNQVCTADVPTLSSLTWSPEFVDFVNKCLVKDVNERWSVNQLLDHPFVRESVERMRNGECSTVLKKLSEELKKASPCKPYPRSFFFLKNGERGLEVEEGIKIMNQNEVQGVSEEQNVIANTHTHQLVKVKLDWVRNYKELDLGDGKKWKGLLG
ncbi:hypothetical protein WA577_004845 [Blastocystis sp. JDR]